MLVSEIEAKEGVGRDLFNESDAEYAIQRDIELPLRKACSTFFKKGIKTVMSSANKHNVAKDKRLEKKDIILPPEQYMLQTQRPTYEDAGVGYAWIMLEFDSLSDENKDWLFTLEERKNENGDKVGEKGVWFIQPCRNDNLDYQIQIGTYTHEQLKEILTDEEIPKGIEYDKRLSEFHKRRILLAFNNMYPFNEVILRYPINESTTVEEVEDFFYRLSESFKDQSKELPKVNSDDEKAIKNFFNSEMNIN